MEKVISHHESPDKLPQGASAFSFNKHIKLNALQQKSSKSTNGSEKDNHLETLQLKLDLRILSIALKNYMVKAEDEKSA